MNTIPVPAVFPYIHELNVVRVSKQDSKSREDCKQAFHEVTP